MVRYAGAMGALLLSAELWIAGGRLLDAQGTRSAALAVEAGRIAGEARRPPTGARTVDASGLLLLPAFVDAHVHLSVAGNVAEVARAAAEEAHRLGLRVAAHALDADAVRRALAAGADVLAHTPVEPLPDDVVREIAARKLWVISTLHAFGGTTGALDNLRRLRAAGVRVAYGTDLGNQGTAPGIDAKELALLGRAGLSLREAIDAATAAAAELLGERDLGHLRRGAAASVIGVPEAALQDARLLARPALVLIEGAPPP